MTRMMPRARANIALPNGFAGTRASRPAGPRDLPGQVPLPAREPHYFPSKGAHFAKRRVLRRPHTILAARRRVAEWLAAADPRTSPQFTYMADYWAALNDVVEPHGEMAWFLRYNH